MSVGILLGGLAGSVVGALSGNELFTIVAYAVGFVGGAAIGGCVGWRWHKRTQKHE